MGGIVRKFEAYEHFQKMQWSNNAITLAVTTTRHFNKAVFY